MVGVTIIAVQQQQQQQQPKAVLFEHVFALQTV